MGRPPIEIDINELATLMRFKPSQADCAAFFKCSEDTIARRIKEHTTSEEFPSGLTFAEFREQNLVPSRFAVYRVALGKALSGDNEMIKFVSKNIGDWSDRKAGEADVNVNVYASKTDQELEAKARELLSKTGIAYGPTEGE